MLNLIWFWINCKFAYLSSQETETYTLAQLREYTASIQDRLQVQRQHCESLRETLVKARAAHQKEVSTLNQRVEQEKQATNEAIERMEALQMKLKEYQLKYGELLEDC